MVNIDKMTAELTAELAFSEEELALLAKARNTPIFLMKIVRRQLQNVY